MMWSPLSVRPRTACSSALLPHSRPTPGGAELDDLLDHVALLVDLDRVDGGVAPFVPEFLDGVLELGGQGLDPGLEDVGEAEQQRQADALGVEVEGQVVEVESALGIRVGVDDDAPLGVDPEEAEAPALHVVQLLRVLDGPVIRGDGQPPGTR